MHKTVTETVFHSKSQSSHEHEINERVVLILGNEFVPVLVNCVQGVEHEFVFAVKQIDRATVMCYSIPEVKLVRISDEIPVHFRPRIWVVDNIVGCSILILGWSLWDLTFSFH